MSEPSGDCGRAAFHEAWRLHGVGYYQVRLCHGEVGVEGAARHFHAWAEYRESSHGTQVASDVSNGFDVRLPVDAYYRAGDITDVHRYTVKRARELAVQHRRYGPWGWDTTTGL